MRGKQLRTARENAGLTQQQLARAVGVSRAAVAQWETGKTSPSTGNVARIAKILGVSLDLLLGVSEQKLQGFYDSYENISQTVDAFRGFRDVSPEEMGGAVDHSGEDNNRGLAASRLSRGARDLPVVGSGVCGQDMWTDMNGQVNEFAPRPGNLEGVKGAYALYVFGSSMEPQFTEGQIVHVHPYRPITAGCAVVVQLTDDTGLIKRFTRRDSRKWVLEQLNPKRALELPASKVRAVHRVIGWSEP